MEQYKKYLPIIGLSLTLILLISAGSFLYLRSTGALKSSTKDTSTNTTKAAAGDLHVESWDPSTGKLRYKQNGSSAEIEIKAMNPVIIINKNAPNQPMDEEVVLWNQSEFWNQAFCINDTLEFLHDNKDEPDKLTHIRNKGPRSCMNR